MIKKNGPLKFVKFFNFSPDMSIVECLFLDTCEAAILAWHKR